MATQVPLEEKGKNEDLIGLDTARRVLKERVSELRTSIEKIEQELSAELDRLEKEHTERESEYTNKMSSLTAIRASIEDQFKSGDFEDLKTSILSDTDKKMEALEREYPPHSVELVWEDRVGEQLKKIGSVVVSVGRREEKREVKLDNYTPEPIPVVVDTPVELTADIHTNVIAVATDYKLRRKPVTTVPIPRCNSPQGIAYDYMDNAIYIVDSISCILHTYSLTTKKVLIRSQFASFIIENKKVAGYSWRAVILGPNQLFPQPTSLNEDSILTQPYAIEFRSNLLFVSAKCRHIAVEDFIASLVLNTSYRRENKFKCLNDSVKIMGKHGSQEGEMNTPTGIAFSESYLYVCDYNNNRINVYLNHYIIRTITHTFLYLPLDVKIHEKSMF